MNGGDRRKPLWASSLADQRRSDHDDVIVRVLEEEPEEDGGAPDGEREPRRRPSRMLAILGALVVVAVVALADGEAWTTDEVPSYWGRVPMTCETLRVEEDERAGEWFSCRAVGGGRLPPGLYLSPESQWRSDITGRPARESRIRISRDGEVEGWAGY